MCDTLGLPKSQCFRRPLALEIYCSLDKCSLKSSLSHWSVCLWCVYVCLCVYYTCAVFEFLDNFKILTNLEVWPLNSILNKDKALIFQDLLKLSS